MNTDYPLRVVNEFQKANKGGHKSFIISPGLLEITKPIISIEIPNCEPNEI